MWTKSQKVSAAVLGLAVVAFGVDRFVLSAPAAGEAADSAEQFVVVRPTSVTSAADVATPADSAKPASPTPPAQAVTLASRLAAMGESRRFAYEAAGDAFRPADAWVNAWQSKAPAPRAGAELNRQAHAAPRVDHATAFRRKHTLTAVMTKQDSGGMAIVNGKLYAPGQVLDGFKLTHVGATDATFTGKGTSVILKVAGQQLPLADAR